MAEEKDIKLSPEEEKSLKDIVKSCEKEDEEIWKCMSRQWKKAEEFWKGVQYLFWDSANETWGSPIEGAAGVSTNSSLGLADQDEEDQLGSFSDKVVDIYKGHGESIVSALASQIPALRYLPDDADQDEDTLTARTYSKIADLIQRHNKAKLIFLKALFYLANHGIVASYRYKDSDFAYGSKKVPTFGEQEVTQTSYTCPDCGYEAEQSWSGNPCPNCGSIDEPEENETKSKVPVQTGIEDQPKTRIKLDIFGALHFKVPIWSRNQKECSYFGLRVDQGKDTVCEMFPVLYDEIQSDQIDNLERFTRASFSYPTEQDISVMNLITIGRWWLRPAALNRETRKTIRESLKKKFPKGCKVTLVGKEKHIGEVKNEDLDDRWEIGQAGLSTYIYSDPLLRPLIQIQEMRNQLVNLIVETIEHGIPSEFADPQVLNFDTYSRFEAVPGYIYKTKAGRPGEPIGNSFYTSNRATLSREVAMFLKQLDQDAQFATGSFPSIYGGPSEGKSRTYAEYAASRQMALQRLSIVWTLVVDWWVRTIDGAVHQYADLVVEDEKFTQFKDGNFINVWIKRSAMQGKVGGVEPEASESFPVSLAQKKDLILKLMEMQNEYINSALYKPENARLIQDVLALNELKLPGEEQRIKQIMEIQELIKPGNEAIPTGEMGPDGQEVTKPTVPIDPNVDDDDVHIGTLIGFMVDLPGLDVAKENPAGYANLTAHLKAHQLSKMMKTASAASGTPSGTPPPTAHAGVEE
jgi:hypothetical protein